MDAVVAHPRSGTTFVTALLNAGGEIAAHEYLAKLSSMAVSIPTAFYEGRAKKKHVRRLLEHYAHTATPEIRIDSNWKLTWILPVFLEQFPDARVLHLSRDPRHVIRSAMNLGYYGKSAELPEFRGDRERNYWLSNMPKVRDKSFERASELEKNCLFWRESERLIAKALAGRARVLALRFEDLVAEAKTAESVFEFFGIAPPSRPVIETLLRQKLNERTEMKLRLATLRPLLPKFEEWPEADRARLIEICGPTAARLGYDVAAWAKGSGRNVETSRS